MKKVFVLSVAGLLLISSVASANIISYAYNKPLSSTNWTQSFNIQQFDPSLGTLNSVTISVAGSLSQTFMFENTGASAGTITFRNGSTTGCLYNVNYTGGSNLVSLDILNTPTYSYTAWDGVTNFAGTSGKTDTVAQSGSNFGTYTDAATLAAFSGLGTVALDAKATGRSYWSATSGNMAVGVSTRAGTDVTVTYEYVPEPATIMLLGLGGLLLGRRK